jgi:GNAT superfamily N-acetyltransferase
MSIAIRRATRADVDVLAPLFSAYRVFYAQPEDPAAAAAFLDARLDAAESVVWMAEDGDRACTGFVQLYPLFSSVRLSRVWLLNDLFVAAKARRAGVARALLAKAEAFAREEGALRLELETTPDNAAAQALYREAGWLPFDGTRRFHLPLSGR